jgi:hypothetical protein
MVTADWMQGPYVYALYSEYGFSKGDIGILFIAGFGSSLVFGTGASAARPVRAAAAAPAAAAPAAAAARAARRAAAAPPPPPPRLRPRRPFPRAQSSAALRTSTAGGSTACSLRCCTACRA